MAARRIVHEYQGSGWVHDTELVTVVVESWVEEDDDGTTGGTSGWGGHGIAAADADSTDDEKPSVLRIDPGIWTLRLDNGQTGAVHVSELTGPGERVRFDGLGVSPLGT